MTKHGRKNEVNIRGENRNVSPNFFSMKTSSFFFGIFLALLLYWGCKEEVTPSLPSQMENKTFTSVALASNPAGNPTLRDMTVYTPKGYDPTGNEKYPVVYLLHGLPFSDSAYISIQHWDTWVDPNSVFKTYPDFPQNGFKAWMDDLIEAKTIEPVIVVMPDAASAPYGFCFYTNSALNGNFEDYIAYDVVEFIDANYKTIASKDGRAIIGHSQGGYGAIKMGLKHADLFGVVAAHSAPLYFEGFKTFIPAIIAENPDGMLGPDPTKFLTSSIYAFSAAWSPNLTNPPFMVDLPFEYPSGAIVGDTWARWLEHDPFTLLETHKNELKSLDGIYFDAGLSDVFMFNLASDAFHLALDASGITHTYENFEGDHFDKMFERLEVSLAFCSQRMKL